MASVWGELKIVDLATGEVRRFSNLVTSGGQALIRDYLLAARGDAAPNPPLYVAYGSGIFTPGRFMSQVPGETYRTPIVDRQATGAASIVYSWFVKDTDNAGQTVGMYGLIAGDATPAAGTGTLFAVAAEPVPFGKTASKSYSGSWTITVSGIVA